MLSSSGIRRHIRRRIFENPKIYSGVDIHFILKCTRVQLNKGNKNLTWVLYNNE